MVSGALGVSLKNVENLVQRNVMLSNGVSVIIQNLFTVEIIVLDLTHEAIHAPQNHANVSINILLLLNSNSTSD